MAHATPRVREHAAHVDEDDVRADSRITASPTCQGHVSVIVGMTASQRSLSTTEGHSPESYDRSST